MNYNKNITEYINSATEEQIETLENLRKLIHETVDNVSEEIKWKMPVFSNGKDFAYLRFSKNNLKEENEVDSLNIMAFEARDKSLKENCNFTINLTNTNEEKAALKIIAKLKEVVNGSKF